MNSNASNISVPKFGYDFVVATTQASTNATMLSFFSTRQEPTGVIVCFVADSKGNPVIIDYDLLKKNAHGTDPFSVHLSAGADVTSNPAIHNLIAARFLFAFQAQIGIPRVSNPSSLPNIVTLGSAVQFNLLCSQFTVVQLGPGNKSLLNISQPVNAPWVFSSKVNMHLSTVNQSAYSNFPPIVQQGIKNFSNTAFSVQRLLFDLSN